MAIKKAIPLLSEVSSVTIAFNPAAPGHIPARLLLNMIDTPKLRAEYPTAKLTYEIGEHVQEPIVKVLYSNNDQLKMVPGRDGGLADIVKRMQRAIKRVMNTKAQ